MSDSKSKGIELYCHPDYAEACKEWETIRDVIEGTSAVKRAGKKYLPELSGQEPESYLAYRDRAVFFGATKRTKEALAGMLMRKPPQIEHKGGDDQERLFKFFTAGGLSLNQYIRTLAEAMVSTGRMVSLIDYDSDLKRPFVATYHATDVLNWATTTTSTGQRKLCLLLLQEQEDTLTGMVVERVTRYRLYTIENEVVMYRTWTDTDDATPDKIEGTPMTKRGIALTEIPAVFHNSAHLGPEIGEAPLYDIAAINLSHYRTSADLENGRHIAGLPTPYATGVDNDSDPLYLGCEHALTSEKPEASFGFLEFTGQGLGELTKALEEKAQQMAVLGARMLFSQSKDAEAFETVKLRTTSETAALSNVAGHLTVTATQVLQWFIWWESTNKERSEIEASVMINKDFAEASMDPQKLSSLVTALSQGTMSFDTFYHQMEKGEIYPEDWDMEREIAAIAQRPPTVTPPVETPEKDDDDDEGGKGKKGDDQKEDDE